MPTALKLLGQVQLGTGLTTIYTTPSQPPNTITRVSGIWVCNTDSADRTVTLRLGTGTLTAANSLGEAWVIPSNHTFFISDAEFTMMLPAGYYLQGLSDAASKITVTAFGEEIS
jgi:hypothetical protein